MTTSLKKSIPTSLVVLMIVLVVHGCDTVAPPADDSALPGVVPRTVEPSIQEEMLTAGGPLPSPIRSGEKILFSLQGSQQADFIFEPVTIDPQGELVVQ